MQKEENRRNKRENTVDAKKGKTVTGIAILAITLASVFAVVIGGTSAYSVGGPYNIIKNDGGAGVQPVLIGQDLDFSAEWVGTVTVARVVDGTEEWCIVADAQNHIHVSEAEMQWTRPGAFYVNYVDVTTYDAQLSVSEPRMPLKLKVGTKEVSSLAVGSPGFKIDVAGINLFDNDKVDLVVIGPNGQIKYDTANNQDFTSITVQELEEYYGDGNFKTAGWDIGYYTFQIKTEDEYACGLDAESNVNELKLQKGEIVIEADTSDIVELQTVNLAVTGVAGDEIRVRSTPCANASFKGGINDTPSGAGCSFTQMIKAEGVMNYAIEFTGSGTFTIKVTVVSGPRNGEYDTVEITVSDKTVTFVVPSAVVIGEDLTIRGTANTGDTVDIAVDDYVYALLNGLAIDETGEFRVDLNTATAGIAPFTDPGPVRLTAYINRAAGTGQVSGPGDGTAKLYMLNEAGGGIDISASETNIGKNETVILTIGAIPNRNVSVTTADSAHTAFEYNRYDFSGTSNNIINIAPAGTISIPSDIGDCGSQTAAMNIHGVWNKMDGDGKLKFEVHFTETGTYTITATDYGTDYPTATRLDDDEIEISVLEKNVTFDLPSIVVIGDKLEIKGTAASGSSVDIFVEDVLYPLLDDIAILEGEFSEVVTTTDVGLCVPDWIKLKAYIDCNSGPYSPPPTIDDGLTNVFLVKPWLTTSLSPDSVDQEAEFTVSGVAPGSTEVEIVCVPPKGGGGISLTEDRKGISITTASVSTTDGTFTKNLTVQENASSGYYYIILLSPGMDGVWDMTAESDLIYAIDYRYGIYDITDPSYAGTKTQEDIIEIFEDLTQSVGSDDLMQMLTIKVGEVEILTLNPVPDLIAGTPLKVTGATSREDDSIIWITVKKPYYEIVPQAAVVKDNTFNATFDTTGAQSGTYTVKATDGSGYTAATNVDILAETQAQGLFVTGKGSYPSIKGTNGGTITIKKMYTYSCSGTDGHSEYAAFYDQNGTLIEEGHWNGYQSGDYRYITFNAPFTLEIGETYNYTIKTGSYPQIIHDRTHLTENGTITCTEFVDANGKRYNNWIPAIKLE